MDHDPLVRSLLLHLAAFLFWISAASGQVEIRPTLGLSAAGPSAKRLLIVAPEAFHATLSSFVRHKRALLPTELASLEEVLRQTDGVDDPEKLKRFLFTKWRTDGVGYVLLVGDVDVLPVRYMVLDRITEPAFDYAFYPSDLYYADLARQDGSFDDWNSQKEGFHAGYFGEVRGEKNKQDAINYDQVDYRPDIAVGRWPASTPQEVALIATKTMDYETALLRGTKKGANRAALFFVSGWVDARERMDRAIDVLADDWSLEKRIYSDNRRKYETPPPDEAEAVQLLNEGVGLVIHAGHGTDTRWEQSLSVRSLREIANADRLPVIISAGCSTAICSALGPYQAYVDVAGNEHAGTDRGEVFTAPPPPPAPYQRGRCNPTGLGEQLLRGQQNGAVAYIGCNTGSQPCALSLVEGFTRELAAHPEARLGDCWTSAVAYYFQREQLGKLVPTDSWYPASIFFQGMKFMLFGDPSLPMRHDP